LASRAPLGLLALATQALLVELALAMLPHLMSMSQPPPLQARLWQSAADLLGPGALSTLAEAQALAAGVLPSWQPVVLRLQLPEVVSSVQSQW
jgi:hypothetical protein